jgi:flavin reductase (DIM6/NTAB) family NADH-FMN oxidoreductase RutF
MTKVKQEIQSGPMPILIAHPVVLVGADVDGKPDFAAVAWTGVAAHSPPTITIGLQSHRYSLKGIRQNMTFSVNIPSTENAAETDYCGLVSGADTDKVADCGLKIFYGKVAGAPMIEQFPVNHACEVLHLLNLGSHILVVGKILETYYDDSYAVGARLDASKVKPLIFANGAYYGLGKQVGASFKIGSYINPEKVKAARKNFPPLKTVKKD